MLARRSLLKFRPDFGFRFLASSSAPIQLKRTPLYDLHVEHGGKMVPFAGFSMPVLYAAQSLTESHIWTRTKAGLFDVSHMVQFHVRGQGALPFLESVVPAGLQELAPFSGQLTIMTNEQGGIRDDLIVTKHTDEDFYVVTNAACRDKDLNYLNERLAAFNKNHNKSVTISLLDDHSLVALQGPQAAEALQFHIDRDLSVLKFGQSAYRAVDGVQCHVARGGYTGEDGFEISMPNTHAATLTASLLADGSAGRVALAGLGARDSLRLEAGMCLYGNDLDDTTTPNEAGLLWTIPKRRRQEANFPGAEVVLKQLDKATGGPARKRVGFTLRAGGAPARAGAEIIHPETGKSVGIVTSGCPSPSLGSNIAMGYVESAYSKVGTALGVKVRKNVGQATVAKMPFVPTRYFK
jgi:aminomethyltransferase